MEVKCKRCGKEWIYTGDKIKLLKDYPQYISCPKCNTSVKLTPSSKRLTNNNQRIK